MATDIIIIHGDQAIFQSAMGMATVTVKPGKMIASGKTTLNGTKVCVSGDEAKVMVQGCDYTTSTHTQAGVGILMIKALAGDQLASKSNSGKKPMILKGSQFDALFQVLVPALDTKPVSSGGPPIPDPNPFYEGKGEFKPTNRTIKAK